MKLAPVELAVGDWTDLGELVDRLVTLAYTRVEMVEKRGEIAVRGGILDIFPPTADHPVRVEFFGDEITDMRTFAVTDQRSIDAVESLTAPACREILLTEEVRNRAAHVSAAGTGDPTLAEMLGKLAAGIAVEGMEALIPVLVPGRLTLLPELLLPGTHVVLADPERIRTRAEDLVRTGADFLAASWMAAATGGKAPIDLAESAYRTLGEVEDVIRDHELPLWRIAPFGVDNPDDPTAVVGSSTSTARDRRRPGLPRRDRRCRRRCAGAGGARGCDRAGGSGRRNRGASGGTPRRS